ncbi:hypothetical protein UY3_17213 [Chelonia mydas]|uniref:Uncharacterized protein n=1 Tax=Chelonia mydas TaxID=8469 RepID=M7AS41_CHEMY|nr:hypothetical protein UY3_17213 [Chelonia mydas]
MTSPGEPGTKCQPYEYEKHRVLFNDAWGLIKSPAVPLGSGPGFDFWGRILQQWEVCHVQDQGPPAVESAELPSFEQFGFDKQMGCFETGFCKCLTTEPAALETLVALCGEGVGQCQSGLDVDLALARIHSVCLK